MAATGVNLLRFPLSKTLPVPSIRFPPPSRRSFPLSAPSFRPLAAATELFDRAEPAVVDPGLRQSEVIVFNSGYHAQIVVDEAESEEALVRRFRREVSKSGVIQEYKRRRFFENKQEEKKRKVREAGRRNRRRRFGPRFSSPFSAEDDSAPQKVRDDDNWDLPDGVIPY
ncbi:30S ribosomal protein S21, chloroplastic-like [Zingiber officinale]|uniref:30S ribosomal protein S21, chloroplastic n=1 Tax=Zingiber officinale TaxID=94328 RepID=A0A8J5H3F0_ZINOF|nr:30S ribosomal protein S21, chloroplastic-like [Zingiber officinale]KAG6515578.1 hypothetical protein ZIOFF_026007 [Zingiber officinale]